MEACILFLAASMHLPLTKPNQPLSSSPAASLLCSASVPPCAQCNHATHLRLFAFPSVPAQVKRAGGWVAPLADSLQSVLEFLQTGLNAAHVPYSYGYSIILLTLLVKLATFPFTKKQVGWLVGSVWKSSWLQMVGCQAGRLVPTKCAGGWIWWDW